MGLIKGPAWQRVSNIPTALVVTGSPGLGLYQLYNSAKTEHLPPGFWQNGPKQGPRSIRESITDAWVTMLEAFAWGRPGLHIYPLWLGRQSTPPKPHEWFFIRWRGKESLGRQTQQMYVTFHVSSLAIIPKCVWRTAKLLSKLIYMRCLPVQFYFCLSLIWLTVCLRFNLSSMSQLLLRLSNWVRDFLSVIP